MDHLRNEARLKINTPYYDEFQLFSEPEYRKTKKYQLRLITEDINEVNEVINSLVSLQFQYTICSQVDLTA